MQEFIGAVAILAGFVWAVLYGLGLNGRLVPAGGYLLLVALFVMIGAGDLIPAGDRDDSGEGADEEL